MATVDLEKYFLLATESAAIAASKWIGKGDKEKAIDIKTKKIIIKVNSKYFRPNEVDNLRGNPQKAKKALNWKPKINLKQLIKEMIDYEIESQG